MHSPYRTGNHNARNIYKYNFAADRDEHKGVMFTPEDGREAVDALNLLYNNRKTEPAIVYQYMVRAYTAGQSGTVASEHAQPYRTYYAFAHDEQEAARVFHAHNPLAVIRDLWQLMPPGYLGSRVFTPDRDDRDLCATPVKTNACTVDEEVQW